VLESLATTLQGPMREAAGDTPPPTNPFAALASEEGMQGLLLMLAPVLLGVQAGAMAGHLAHDGLARYDHMLPLSDEADLAFVLSNIGRFANEWSLELDDVSFAVALRELVRAGQRTVPWLGPALVERALRFVTGYDAGGDDLEARFGDFELGDVSSMQDLLGDPSSVLGMIRSPEQEPARADLHRLVAVLEGYTDVTVASIGARLVTSFGRIDEALRRRRLERGSAGAFLDQLLGLDVTRDDFEAGRAFCAGVVEREGMDGLNRLWERAEHVPTPAELDAPGLWLARIDLD
jgi:putative hydrolase